MGEDTESAMKTLVIIAAVMARGISNPEVRQCFGFGTADFSSSLAYESAEQKPKHCLTPRILDTPAHIRLCLPCFDS